MPPPSLSPSTRSVPPPPPTTAAGMTTTPSRSTGSEKTRRALSKSFTFARVSAVDMTITSGKERSQLRRDELRILFGHPMAGAGHGHRPGVLSDLRQERRELVLQ